MALNERTVRNWLPVVAVIIVNLLTLGIIFGSFSARLDAVEKHAYDKSVHMPYQEKIKIFPTREEFQRELATSDNQMARMESKLDRIYEMLMKGATE